MGEILTLSDVCEELVDCVNRTAPEASGGGYFVVGTPAMRGNTINFSEARRICSETFARWTRRLAPKEGDLLLAREAPVGPVVRIPAGDNIAAGQRTMHLRANPAVVHPKYLFYLLASPKMQNRIFMLSMGSTVAHLRVAEAKSLALPALPALVEQRAIAEVLGALDDKIAVNDRLHSLADELCATEVKQAQVAGSLRPLRELSTFHYGKSLPVSRRTEGHVHVYGSGGLSGSHTVPLVDKPGIVVGRKGTVGAVYWADRPHHPIDTTYFVEPIFDKTDAVLYYVLKSTSLAELNSDSAVPGLNRDELYSHQVRVPSRTVMLSLVESFRERFFWMKSLRDENQELQSARDSLLPLLMSGKVRVRDAEKVVEGVV